MSIALALLLTTFAGDDAPAQAEAPRYSFEIRYISFNSLDWRGAMMPYLQPVARRGGAAVWSMDFAAVRTLLETIQGDAGSDIVQAPRTVAPLGQGVRVVNETAHNYVAHLRRIADGPPGEATELAFVPEVDQIREGIQVDLTGNRVLDQGVLAEIAVEEDRLLGFQHATYTETVHAETRVESRPKSGNLLVDRLFRSVGIASQENGIAVKVQVPEVASSHIAGEWLIPRDGALLVSLGAGTWTGESGKDRYEEHLVMISYQPLNDAKVPAPLPPVSQVERP